MTAAGHEGAEQHRPGQRRGTMSQETPMGTKVGAILAWPVFDSEDEPQAQTRRESVEGVIAQMQHDAANHSDGRMSQETIWKGD